jgi:hypothetical protein
MKTLHKCALVCAMLVTSLAHAAPRTFDFVFDGGAAANSAKAVGAITFEDILLNNTFDPNQQFVNYIYAIGGPEVLALSVTVSGASAGNGVFGMADFDHVEWQTNGTLNLGQQLVGQPTRDKPWGTPEAGLGGDFNLFARSALAPSGVAPFELSSAGGESMLLVSMAPASAVPESATWAMLVSGFGLLLLALAGRRRLH